MAKNMENKLCDVSKGIEVKTQGEGQGITSNSNASKRKKVNCIF
jgi:hypothetical protein